MKIKRNNCLADACAARDNYICQICKTDTQEIQKLLNHIRFIWIQARNLRHRAKYLDMSQEELEAYTVYKAQLDYCYENYPEVMTKARRKGSLNELVPRLKHEHAYEINHKIPLILGGDDCLSNLELLCLNCHRLETKKLNDELKKQRKRTQKRRNKVK